MPFRIIRKDITTMECDAIVNAANRSLLGGGGVDGAIHRAAGPLLLKECETLNGCATGDAKVTGGYNLPCKYVIHTVGPRYRDGRHGEKDALISCYRRSLEAALEKGCESVAFPLISSGAYGYPPAEAARVAADTIKDFIARPDVDIDVTLCVYDKRSFMIGKTLFGDIAEYIGENEDTERYKHELSRGRSDPDLRVAEDFHYDALVISADVCAASTMPNFDDIDESFSEAVFRIIRERNLDEVACYKKANIDRKLFSKIRSHPDYQPKKTTAVALAIGLELGIDETEDLLRKAGYALSRSTKFDLIVRYFIENENYDIFEINEALFGFDQAQLGSF